MSEAKANPKAAVDALLEHEPIDNVSIWPATIARYALLELIDSPFTRSFESLSVADIVPSIYVFTLPPEKLKKYSRKNLDELQDDAFAWSESI